MSAQHPPAQPPPTPVAPRLWDVKVLSGIFSRSTVTIRTWARNRKSGFPEPACWVDNQPFWRPEDIGAFLAKKPEGGA